MFSGSEGPRRRQRRRRRERFEEILGWILVPFICISLIYGFLKVAEKSADAALFRLMQSK